VETSFRLQVQLALTDLEAEVLLDTFVPMLDVIESSMQGPSSVLSRKDFDDLLLDIFILAHLLPECYPSSRSHSAFSQAKNLWAEWAKAVPAGDRKEGVLAGIKTKLKLLLCETQVRPL
jgi:hypothetical protein